MVSACSVVLAGGFLFAIRTRGTQVEWLPLLTLGFLFVLSENRGRIFTDETGLSGSIVAALTAASYYGSRSWVGGAFLVCMAGGLYLPQLRAREWAKVCVNAACFGISGAASAAIVVVVAGWSPAWLVVAAVPAALGYWLVNSVFLSAATTALRGGSFFSRVRTLIKAETVMIVFAVGGALCGFVMTEVGVWTGIAALVAALVALDVFVIEVPAGPAVFRSAWKTMLGRLIAGVAAGVCAVLVTSALRGGVAGAVAGLVGGVVLGLVILAGVAVVRLSLAGHRPDGRLLAGLAVAELPLIVIAAVAGVMGALVGTTAALLTASAMAIIGSVLAAWSRRREAAAVHLDDDVLLAAVTEAILDGMLDPAPRP